MSKWQPALERFNVEKDNVPLNRSNPMSVRKTKQTREEQ
jgi:hypothetical protein